MIKNHIDNLIFGFEKILIDCKEPQILIESIIGYFYATLDCTAIDFLMQEQSLYALPKKEIQTIKDINRYDFSFLDHRLRLQTPKALPSEIINVLENLFGGFIEQLHYLQKIENEKINDNELLKQAKNITKAKIISMLGKGFLTSTQNISNSATELEIKHKYRQLKDDVFTNNIRIIFDNNDEIVRNLAIFNSLVNEDNKLGTFTSNYLMEKLEKIFDLFFKNNKIQFVNNIEKITLKTYENALLESLFNIIEQCANSLIKHNMNDKKIYIDWIKNKNESTITIKHITHHNPSAYSNDTLGLYLAKNVICKQINGNISVSNSQIEHNGTPQDSVQYTINLKENNEHY